MSNIHNSFVLAPDSDWLADLKSEIKKIERDKQTGYGKHVNKQQQVGPFSRSKRIKVLGHGKRRLVSGSLGQASREEQERARSKSSKRKQANY